MAAVTRPTLTEIRSRILADIQTRLSGSNPLLRNSTLNVLGTAQAGQVHEVYGYLYWIAAQIFPDTAISANLDRWAQIWGVIRRAAVASTGTITITGTPATVVPAGTVFARSDDAEFTTDIEVTISGLGTVDADVTASVAGAAGDTAAGDTLNATSPVSGMDNAATVSTACTGGLDAEDDPSLLSRVLFRIQYPPHGGAASDYLRWMLENSGVTRAWVLPGCMGWGTVGLSWVYDNRADIFPTAGDLTAMEAYIEEHTDPASGLTVGRPVTARLFFFALEAQPLNPKIYLQPNTVAVRLAVEAELDGFCRRNGNPGSTIRLSNISEAISQATDEEFHRLDRPTADFVVGQGYVLTTGTIEWAAS